MKVAQSCLTLCDPMDCKPARLLCPWNSPGKDTGMDSCSLLQAASWILLPYPSYTTPLLFPLPTGNHKHVLYVCESASFLLYLLICCIIRFSIYGIM